MSTRKAQLVSRPTVIVAAVVLAVLAVIVGVTVQWRAAQSPTSVGAMSTSEPQAMNVAPEAIQAVEPVRVESAEGTVMARMTADFGVDCFSAGSGSIAVPEDLPESLDRHIQAAGITQGWLPPDEKDWWYSGTKQLWVGSLDSFADEYGAEAIYQDELSTWFYPSGENALRGDEVTSFTSAKGVEVWMVSASVAPAKVCAATDE